MVENKNNGFESRAIYSIRQGKNKSSIKGIAFVGFLFLTNSSSFAISDAVMFNCALDYLKFCNGANIEGDEVKQCFKANGKDLSQSCINALKNDGLIRSTTVIQDVTKKTREVVSGVKTKVKKIVESTKQKVESVYDSTEIFSDDGSTIYPKYLEWKDDKQYLGSELTPYGLEDRK